MKKIFSLFAIAVLGLTTVGCTEDTVDEKPQAPTVDGVTMLVAKPEVFAIKHGQETSTELESRTWAAEAKVGVYGTTMGNNVEYKLFSSYAGATEGTFYGNEVQGEIYAYYPYYAGSKRNGSQVTLMLPENQVYNADFGQQMTDYNPTLVAKATTGEIEFNYLVGALGVQVQGGALVKTIKVSSENSALAGVVAVDFARDYNVVAVEESVKSVTLDCGDGVLTSLDEPTTFYVLVPPATYTDLSVTVTVDGGEFTKAVEGSYTIARLTAVDTTTPTANATIVATFDTLQLGAESDDSRVWTENATFGVFAEGVENAKFVIAPNEAGKNEAVFAGADVPSNFVAYYPWSNVAAKSGDVFTTHMNSVQTYNPDELKQFADNAPFMVANGVAGEPLEFKYINGALGIRCKVDGNIKQLDLVGESGAVLSGAVSVNLAENYVASATEGSQNYITLNCGEEGVATSYENPTVLFVCLPVATYNNLEVTLSMEDGSFVKSVVNVPVEVKPLEINVSGKDVTYSVLDIELEQSGLNCKKVWNTDDVVSIFDITNNRLSSGTVFRGMGVGTSKATFTVPSDNLAVIYPAQDFATLSLEGTIASFELPATQQFSGSGVVADSAMPFLGLVNAETSIIYNMLSVLDIKLTGDVSVSKIVVKSSKKKLSGKATLDTAITALPEIQMDATASNTVTVDCGEGFTLSDTATSVCVAIPATSYAENDLTIDVYTDMGVYRNMPTACTLTRATATEQSIVVPKPVSLTLTENDYANCFVLNEAGWYSFVPKTRGGYDRVGNEDILKANTAAYVLYESTEGMLSNATYVPEKGVITFLYDGTAGNGGICVADAPDNICWTWHIWCPGELVKDVAFGSITMMDRNIGARAIPTTLPNAKTFTDLQKLQSAGLIYQMGRPTPFPGAQTWANETANNCMGVSGNDISEKFYYPSAEYLNNGKTFQCGEGKTVESATQGVKNPMCYFNKENVDGNKYWSEDFKEDTNSDNYPWKSTVATNVQYDPCPAGYHLPTYAEMSTAIAAKTPWVNVNTKDMSKPDGLFCTKKNAEAYFANGGCRTSCGLFSISGLAAVNLHVATIEIDSEDDATKYNCYVFDLNSKKGSGAQWVPSNGTHVRCAKNN